MVMPVPTLRPASNVVSPVAFGVSIGLPFGLQDVETLRTLRMEAAELLASLMSNALQRPLSEIVVRDLMPSDVGLTTDPAQDWQIPAPAAANTWDTAFRRQLALDEAVAIFGMVNLEGNPQTVAARFLLGDSQLLAQIHLQPAYGFQQTTLVVIRPTLIWKPREEVHVQTNVRAVVAERIAFLGLMATRKGNPVTPRSD